MNIASKTSAREAKITTCEDKDVHDLTNDFTEGSTIFLDESRELGVGGWELFSEVKFVLTVGTKWRVNRLEDFSSFGGKELINDRTLDVISLVE